MDTGKAYYDTEGNECSIWQMVMREPHWAANRIQEGEKAIDEIASLRAEVEALKDPGYVRVPVEAIEWLNGERGEFVCPPENYFRGEPPAYWWRTVFREKAMLAAAAGESHD